MNAVVYINSTRQVDMKVFVFLLSFVLLALCELDERKSIVYDKKTPDVFYCPINHHDNIDEMLVRSRPLHKLCEYNGESLPEGYRSDCYGDVDESPFACKEKRRIMRHQSRRCKCRVGILIVGCGVHCAFNN